MKRDGSPSGLNERLLAPVPAPKAAVPLSTKKLRLFIFVG